MQYVLCSKPGSMGTGGHRGRGVSLLCQAEAEKGIASGGHSMGKGREERESPRCGVQRQKGSRS